MKKFLVLLMACVFVLTGCISIEFEEDTEAPTNESEKTPHKEANWRDDFSAELVEEIESAFEEIGENPNNIISIEYVDIHTSGYVFEQKCYKVEFKWSLGKPGYKHSRYYRIVTQNYYEGEPEKEEYPNEFLCTIKYWAGDDGHGTNINQWSWTGNGKMQ